jgi:hypothetical protein
MEGQESKVEALPIMLAIKESISFSGVPAE